MTTESEAKNPGGRPTMYRDEYAEQAIKLTRLGATDVELADFFGVSVQTVHTWRHKHPKFLEASKIGKEAFDERVVSALASRAIGHSLPETDIRVVEGQIVQTPVIKHLPPDTAACIFWLKNRRRDEWRDRVEIDAKGLPSVVIKNLTGEKSNDGKSED